MAIKANHELFARLITEIRSIYGDQLQSIVLFGSVAYG